VDALSIISLKKACSDFGRALGFYFAIQAAWDEFLTANMEIH
jgi:hypothetical protein